MVMADIWQAAVFSECWDGSVGQQGAVLMLILLAGCFAGSQLRRLLPWTKMGAASLRVIAGSRNPCEKTTAHA